MLAEPRRIESEGLILKGATISKEGRGMSLEVTRRSSKDTKPLHAVGAREERL